MWEWPAVLHIWNKVDVSFFAEIAMSENVETTSTLMYNEEALASILSASDITLNHTTPTLEEEGATVEKESGEGVIFMEGEGAEVEGVREKEGGEGVTTREEEGGGELTVSEEEGGEGVTMREGEGGTETLAEEEEGVTVREGESGQGVTIRKKDEGDESQDENGDATTGQDEEWQDILGNGHLMKKVIRKGAGMSTRPTPQSRVRVRSRGFLASGDVVDKHSGYWFTVGDGDVVQAWDIAVTLMERGEVAQVKTTARFAYGEQGKGSTVPSDATITYELELLEVLEPVQFGSVSEEELIKMVERKKTRGNELYKDREYTKAVHSYQKGLQAIQSYLDGKSISPNTPPNLLEIQIRCLNNIAAAQLKVKEYKAALSACESVLQKDSSNVKALYRAGRVLAHIGEMEDAVTRLQKALSLSPQDKTIHTELQRTLRKRDLALQKEKAMYRRMIDPHQSKKSTAQGENTWPWGPWPYMAIAGTTAAIAIGMAYFFTQRH